MAHEITLIGKFIVARAKNADTAGDPYNPTKESPLELDLPNHDLTFSHPSPLPPPPKVELGAPGGLPPPPAVILSIPAVLPPEKAPPQSVPAVLPPELAPPHSIPSSLPPPPATINLLPAPLPLPPATTKLLPSPLPLPPTTTKLLPSPLPLPPATTKLLPSLLPAPPATINLLPSLLPLPPATAKSIPAQLPAAPGFIRPKQQTIVYGKLDPQIDTTPGEAPDPTKVSALDLKTNTTPGKDPDPKKVNPQATPSSGYSILGETYSPMLGAADPGSLATDPFLHERQIERLARTDPGKVALHALTQVGLFAQNVYGTVWNPALILPPPIGQFFLKPALDLGDGSKDKQVQIGELVNFVLSNTPNTTGKNLVKPDYKTNNQDLAVIKERQGITRGLSAAFDNIANNASNLFKSGGGTPAEDPIKTSGVAFENGIIPMKLKGDNKFGFRVFAGGQPGAEDTSADSVYVPLCFTDLRPVGDVYRTVYFRPIITSLAESLSPEWNKSQYFGRVDPVATYMSTTRTISLGFDLVAFGPEDVRTIYQKLHWLSSLTYPELDKNLSYRSGPVVRMRIGDVVNAIGSEGAYGLPGIIENLNFDFTDSLWELKENFKLPRHVKVSLTFTVLHDGPVGRGKEGNFGVLGQINQQGTDIRISDIGESNIAREDGFRKFGSGQEVTYETLKESDEK